MIKNTIKNFMVKNSKVIDEEALQDEEDRAIFGA